MAVDHTPSTESDRIREMQREIDAIRSRFGNLNIQQRHAGNGSTNQSAAARRANLSTAEKVAERRRWAFCSKCRQWGLHYHDECPRSQAEISRLTPRAKERGEPSGKPFDKAF